MTETRDAQPPNKKDTHSKKWSSDLSDDTGTYTHNHIIHTHREGWGKRRGGRPDLEQCLPPLEKPATNA